ncbi:MAG: FHA domain-containing protein [candidate division WOR-3 bacterium]
MLRAKIRIINGPKSGEVIEIPKGGILIGREEEKLKAVAKEPTSFGLTALKEEPYIIVYKDPEKLLSGKHAWIGYDEKGDLIIIDLNSTNGTFIGECEERIKKAKLKDKDVVRLCKKGVIKFVVEIEKEYQPTIPIPEKKIPEKRIKESYEEEKIIHLTKNIINIGRAPDNDIVLNYPQISRYHCRIIKKDEEIIIYDLNSTNGTFVNGRRIKEARLKIGDRINLGSYAFWLEKKDSLSSVDYSGKVYLEAHSIKKLIKDKVILEDISFTSFPSEFIGLIGPSGCGKTTLLNIITGYDPNAYGYVAMNGLDLYENYEALRNNIGYVPQDDIIHRSLTVYQSLYYTAKLRLPEDTSEEEIRERVEKVIRELGLEDCKNVRIGDPLKKGISGGQRKRVNLAQELITEPTCLFLDEPTSGLDGAKEIEIMELLKEIAQKGKNVILTTHNLRPHNFEIITNILLLHKGRLVYYGPGKEVFDYFGFGKDMPEKIFFHLEGKYCPNCDTFYLNIARPVQNCEKCGKEIYKPPEYWDKKFKESIYYKKYIVERMEIKKVSTKTGYKQFRSKKEKFNIRQWWILTQRYWKIKLSDTISTSILLLQAPIISFLFALVFKDKSFHDLGPLIFMMAIAAIWFGATNSCREIVAERSVYLRERMVNLKIPSYVLSKVFVLALFLLFQCFILSGVTKALVKELPGSIFAFTLVLFFGALAGCLMGLFISSLLTSTEGAMGLVPITLIPQILFGGTLIPLHELGSLRFLADLMISRWTIDGLANIGNLRNILWFKETLRIPGYNLYFDILILIILTILFTALTFFSLKTKDIV